MQDWLQHMLRSTAKWTREAPSLKNYEVQEDELWPLLECGPIWLWVTWPRLDGFTVFPLDYVLVSAWLLLGRCWQPISILVGICSVLLCLVSSNKISIHLWMTLWYAFMVSSRSIFTAYHVCLASQHPNTFQVLVLSCLFFFSFLFCSFLSFFFQGRTCSTWKLPG